MCHGINVQVIFVYRYFSFREAPDGSNEWDFVTHH